MSIHRYVTDSGIKFQWSTRPDLLKSSDFLKTLEWVFPKQTLQQIHDLGSSFKLMSRVKFSHELRNSGLLEDSLSEFTKLNDAPDAS